jgi:hypothetical protein
MDWGTARSARGADMVVDGRWGVRNNRHIQRLFFIYHHGTSISSGARITSDSISLGIARRDPQRGRLSLGWPSPVRAAHDRHRPLAARARRWRGGDHPRADACHGLCVRSARSQNALADHSRSREYQRRGGSGGIQHGRSEKTLAR